MRTTELLLGMRLDATSYERAAQCVLDWAREGLSRYVCIANVHMVMETRDRPEYRQVVNAADMVTPDGMPLVWMLRRLGHPDQTRVYGPTLMLHVCALAEVEGVPVGFYGATDETIVQLKVRLIEKYPRLKIAYTYAPPFRALTSPEEETVRHDFMISGARILFVGLGCPKQEQWMAQQRGRLPAVMLGVGAAFDFHAGRVRQAPGWLQNIGMEWFFRLIMEPRRLWKRYFKHNPRFAILALLQLIRRRPMQMEEGKA